MMIETERKTVVTCKTEHFLAEFHSNNGFSLLESSGESLLIDISLTEMEELFSLINTILQEYDEEES